MNGEGRSGILTVAIILSAAVHFGAMFYARPKVMTHVVPDDVRAPRREAMRVTKDFVRPEPVKIDALAEVDALKDAPVAEEVLESPVFAPESERMAVKLESPAPPAETPEALKPRIDAAVLDAKVLGSDHAERTVVMAAEKLGASGGSPFVAAPEPLPLLPASAVVPDVPVPLVPRHLDAVAEPGRIVREKDGANEADGQAFKPAEEVREKVDEKVVEREKEAVKELLDISDAAELRKFVNVAMTKFSDGKWTYFKTMVVPRHELQVVPKDVVVLIDASGSIGKDRIRSVREAAKKILRSSTNSGDRFNLVAFRDRYSYAFRRWQGCTQSAFDKADAWLDDVAAHGRTDVFATIASVLTLPRDPARPLIALVVTDGDANAGVRSTAEILSKFTALNDGLVSVYMYGVKNSANRELIDVLTRGNRGESFIYEGWWKWQAGSGIEGLCERFRDPVLSDLRVVFAAGVRAEAYPRLLRNLYRGNTLEFFGRVPSGTKEVAFSIKGLNGKEPYEGFFRISFDKVAADPAIVQSWETERSIDLKLK